MDWKRVRLDSLRKVGISIICTSLAGGALWHQSFVEGEYSLTVQALCVVWMHSFWWGVIWLVDVNRCSRAIRDLWAGDIEAAKKRLGRVAFLRKKADLIWDEYGTGPFEPDPSRPLGLGQ